MKKYSFKILFVLMAFLLPVSAFAQGKEIALPAVSEKSGMDYFDSLRNRASIRAYADKDLSPQDLGDVLWSAGGTKTPGGKWVIPFAMHTDPTCKIYVTSNKGTYLYNGKKHALELVVLEDLRDKIAEQDFVKSAPTVLILVADPKPLADTLRTRSKQEISELAHLSYGAIMQDVYLTASSKGLATCYIGHVKKNAVREVLGLKDDEVYFGAMPLGYPVE